MQTIVSCGIKVFAEMLKRCVGGELCMGSRCLIELENPILRLGKSGNILYVISGKKFIKVDSNTGEILQKAEVFAKDSKTRRFIIDKDVIYCRDFYRLYKIDAGTMEIISRWELGSDLSSDICALGSDETNIYASIRNGGFAVINKSSGEVKTYAVSDSSIWDMIVSDRIYAGSVDGNLYVIDKAGFKVLDSKPIHKKNLKSLLLEGDVIYTASQDLSIAKVNKNTLDVIDRKKRCHNKMFYIAGIWQDCLVTVSPPCGEMKVWNKSDFSLYRTVNRGNWDSFIDGDRLYEKADNRIVCTDLDGGICFGWS